MLFCVFCHFVHSLRGNDESVWDSDLSVNKGGGGICLAYGLNEDLCIYCPADRLDNSWV